jgi:hypothetical protein
MLVSIQQLNFLRLALRRRVTSGKELPGPRLIRVGWVDRVYKAGRGMVLRHEWRRLLPLVRVQDAALLESLEVVLDGKEALALRGRIG